MKVAIVHDWLNTKFGGAENVLVELAELFPEAPIYTILYDPATAGAAIAPGRIHPSRLQHLPAFLRQRPRYLLPFIPRSIERFDLSGYDVVISSSSAWVKGVITGPQTLNICYCYSPMRFAWDYWPRYVQEQQVGPLRRAAIHVLTSRLRVWDYFSAARVDRWVAISHHVASRIHKYYRQPMKAISVIYPGADIAAFKPQPTEKEDYFLVLSSLAPYKKIDLAIAACNRLGKRLIVAGDGADRGRLERLAGDTIEFTGRVSDSRRAELLARATAFIFPGEEDFGIAPVEAMASGTPVIAYNRGGLTE
ncbi:MAG TPA: glycosyltransferase, partial [Candidatus Saccharimonadales bacterium]|nr:glycosyltransferase [Candidatus Saccharimonadales bacterium]